jgi:hypothetical protein
MEAISRLKVSKSTLAGLIYVVAGSTAIVVARSYTLGTPLQMGPGFFPALIGAILVLLGISSIVSGLREKTPEPIAKMKLEPLVLIFIGVMGFAFLIGRAGLVAAIAFLLFCACFRRLLTNPLEVLLTFVVLSAFSVLVFIHGFGMQMNAFWWPQ